MGFSKDDMRPGTVAVLGVRFDEYSSFARGCALGPRAIREAFASDSTNRCCENGVDLAKETRLVDAGDAELGTGDPGYLAIEEAAAALLDQGARLISLGGDHSITFPLLKAHARKHGQMNVLHIDAHPDLYDEYQGNRFSNACPFARVMESRLAARLVQVGIRTATGHQREQADRFGVQMVEMEELSATPAFDLHGPVYLSLDLDALDPAFAPGVSHPEPGGLSTRDVIRIIQALDAPIAGADIVELNPTRDPTGITAMVAAKLLKEIAAKMLYAANDQTAG